MLWSFPGRWWDSWVCSTRDTFIHFILNSSTCPSPVCYSVKHWTCAIIWQWRLWFIMKDLVCRLERTLHNILLVCQKFGLCNIWYCRRHHNANLLFFFFLNHYISLCASWIKALLGEKKKKSLDWSWPWLTLSFTCLHTRTHTQPEVKTKCYIISQWVNLWRTCLLPFIYRSNTVYEQSYTVIATTITHVRGQKCDPGTTFCTTTWRSCETFDQYCSHCYHLHYNRHKDLSHLASLSLSKNEQVKKLAFVYYRETVMRG